MRKNCSIDRGKLFKLEAEGPEFELEQFTNSERSVQFLKQNAFLTFSWRFPRSNTLEQLDRIQIGRNNWDLESYRKS